jgi:dTDP-4-amino-4,6-dideoxyglucose formyltransferase
MSFNKLLIISDNLSLIEAFKSLLIEMCLKIDYTIKCSFNNVELSKKLGIPTVNVQQELESIIRTYDLIISLHCKQIFPEKLVNSVKCINVHPGYNPYNRGWFPQVFSIINKQPIGATIHEIDEYLDHGNIIDQQEIEIKPWDTSRDVYNRILKLEVELLQKNISNILKNSYNKYPPKENGNVNTINDYRELCKLDLDENSNLGSFIDKLRALTHEPYKNAYFIDKKHGRKVYIRIILEAESLKLDSQE